jgi:hypothetical protein
MPLVLSLASCGTSSVQIEWINFVKVQGILYAVPFVGESTIPSSLQGSVVASVRFQVADHVDDPNYQTRDGDAAFLPVGTPIYQVIGYRNTFRLAAQWNGHLTLFEANTVPNARIGADLLDIRDKVVRVGVLWNIPTPPGVQEHGSITDPTSVQSLVDAVLAAPFSPTATPNTGTQVFVAFHLRDGTEIVRVFWPADHDLAGIQVPDAVIHTLQPLLPPAATPTETT